MGAFGGSFSSSNVYTDASAQGASSSSSPKATGEQQWQQPKETGAAPSAQPGVSSSQQQMQTQNAPMAAAEKTPPGFDLADGVASFLFAPGRAIVAQFHPPTMKDLPIIIGLSALTYWALYKFVWPVVSESFSAPSARPKAKRKREKEEEEED